MSVLFVFCVWYFCMLHLRVILIINKVNEQHHFSCLPKPIRKQRSQKDRGQNTSSLLNKVIKRHNAKKESIEREKVNRMRWLITILTDEMYSHLGNGPLDKPVMD